MKKVDFNKLQAGDLVEVPRTQFAPMRRGWNGWLFSEAVVIRKGVGRKSKKNVVVVEMRTPAGKNSYGTIEATFYAENVFTTPAAKNARNILKKYGIEDAESFYKFIERDDVTGCDWIRFLIEKGFVIYASAPKANPFSMSLTLFFADKNMTLVCCKLASFLICSKVAKPSTIGIMISSKIISGVSSFNNSKTSEPSLAMKTS